MNADPDPQPWPWGKRCYAHFLLLYIQKAMDMIYAVVRNGFFGLSETFGGCTGLFRFLLQLLHFFD